jgi:hypothetical protein
MTEIETQGLRQVAFRSLSGKVAERHPYNLSRTCAEEPLLWHVRNEVHARLMTGDKISQLNII